MKTVLGCIRKACDDFNLISDGDRIAVGVSGGKDSMLLLRALKLYQYFSKARYELEAVTVLMSDAPYDVTVIQDLCDELSVRYTLKPTDIANVVFNIRAEKNPCALCANIRRGALHTAARALGCNKVALGHHLDDVLETFMMSLIFEGRLNVFSPKTYMTRKDITVIRPMVYLPEKHIVSLTKHMALPTLPNPCPVCGNTKRQEMKELLDKLSAVYPDIRNKMKRAVSNTAQYNLWDKEW